MWWCIFLPDPVPSLEEVLIQNQHATTCAASMCYQDSQVLAAPPQQHGWWAMLAVVFLSLLSARALGKYASPWGGGWTLKHRESC